MLPLKQYFMEYLVIQALGIRLTKEWGQRLYNDRIMLIKLKRDENDLVIIQTYRPTSGYKDEEVEEVYEL
jgi:hypothetical protein